MGAFGPFKLRPLGLERDDLGTGRWLVEGAGDRGGDGIDCLAHWIGREMGVALRRCGLGVPEHLSDNQERERPPAAPTLAKECRRS